MTARSTSESNSPCSAKNVLGAALQLAQDERGDLRRRELAVAEADPDDAAGSPPTRNGNSARLVADVVDALAHEALDGVDRALRVGQQPPLRLAADDRSCRRRPTDTTDGTSASPLASRITTGTPSFT